jgi:nucleoside-diphosphate-sugar epimerase
MQLLILGGTGFLSSALVEAGIAAGHDVTILTRGQRPNSFGASVRCLVADRSDTASFRDALANRRFDVVIDAICFTPEHARQDIDVFAGQAGRLVMISTDFVYSVRTRPVPVREDWLRDAPTEYGRKKAASEDILLEAADRLPVTILRPPHIVGAGSLLGTGSLQGRDAVLPARLKRQEPIVLLDGGALLIQPADKRDIADACLAVRSTSSIGQVYNIMGPEAVTTRRYYEIIAEVLGVPLHVASLPSDVYLAAYPDRASFACHRAYSTEALTRDTGFRPSIPLEQSIREMLAWQEVHPLPHAAAPITEMEQSLIQVLSDRDERARALLG